MATPIQTLIKVKDWNAYVHVPSDYSTNPDKTYPTIIFIPGLGEIGTDPNRLIQNGPGAYLNQGWNGEAMGVKFIVISLQPPGQWPNSYSIKQRVDELRKLYRIGDLYMTGLSMGGWASMNYATEYPTELKKIVSVEGVDIGYGTNLSVLWGGFANAGGKMLNFEQVNDYRVGDKAVEAMNKWKPGSAQYIETNFGGGGHCCWNEFYGGNGKQPGRFNIEGNALNLYEWLAGVFVLPEFITKAAKRGNELSWHCENVEAGDYFTIESTTDFKTFTTISRINENGADYKITI